MSFIRAIVEGYKAATPNRRDWEYDNLLTTPVLHSSDYLNELYKHARTKKQKECIIQHLNKHGAWEVESYRKVGNQYIDERWR